MYKIRSTRTFDEKYVRLVKKDYKAYKRVEKTLHLLEKDPFYPSLRTHKTNTRLYGQRYSSWVTGDLRLIWDFDVDDSIIIIVLDVGSHTGKHKVYGNWYPLFAEVEFGEIAKGFRHAWNLHVTVWFFDHNYTLEGSAETLNTSPALHAIIFSFTPKIDKSKKYIINAYYLRLYVIL